MTLVDIDKLFAKFAGMYGSRWTGQWKDADLLRIARHEWYDKLKSLKIGDIEKGLNLWREDWPPNVVEFRKCCVPAPYYAESGTKALPAPKNIDLGKQCIAKMREMLK